MSTFDDMLKKRMGALPPTPLSEQSPGDIRKAPEPPPAPDPRREESRRGGKANSSSQFSMSYIASMKKLPLLFTMFLLSAYLISVFIDSGPKEVLSKLTQSEKVALATEMRSFEREFNGDVDWIDASGFVKHLLYSDTSNQLGRLRSKSQEVKDDDLAGAIFCIESTKDNIKSIPFLSTIASSKFVFGLASALCGILLMKLVFSVMNYLSEINQESKKKGSR